MSVDSVRKELKVIVTSTGMPEHMRKEDILRFDEYGLAPNAEGKWEPNKHLSYSGPKIVRPQ